MWTNFPKNRILYKCLVNICKLGCNDYNEVFASFPENFLFYHIYRGFNIGRNYHHFRNGRYDWIQLLRQQQSFAPICYDLRHNFGCVGFYDNFIAFPLDSKILQYSWKSCMGFYIFWILMDFEIQITNAYWRHNICSNFRNEFLHKLSRL